MADTFTDWAGLALRMTDVVERSNTFTNEQLAVFRTLEPTVTLTDAEGNTFDIPSWSALQSQIGGLHDDLISEVQEKIDSISDLVFADSPVYPNVSDGLAAVADGAQFKVEPVDPAVLAYSVYRRVDASHASHIADVPSADVMVEKVDRADFERELPGTTPSPRRIAAGFDASGQVPAWFIDGDFETRGLTAGMIRKIFGARVDFASPRRLALGFDLAGNVGTWLDNGKFDAAAVTEHFKSLILAGFQSDSANGIVTDGRSLFAWRSKLVTLDRAGTGHVRIMLTGDSWTDRPAIPNALAAIIRARFARSGSGWISVDGTYNIDGIANSRSGWSLYDASTATAPSRGTGIDGSYIVVTDAVATWDVGSVECDEIRIYYRNHGGVFSYSVNAGDEVTVNCSNDGGLGTVVVSGLTYGSHSFKVNSVAGTVCICGAFATASTPGVEVIKAGNAGITGARMRRITQYIAPIAADCPPDVVIVVLGTNDYRSGNGGTVEGFTACLGELVDQYRAVSPTCGFIVVAPAKTNGVESIPLVQFRDAAAKFCQDRGHEFYDMFSDWGDYATMDGLGMFADSLHTSDVGAMSLCRRINKLLLEIE